VPDDTTRQSVIFNDLFGKPVVARFDQPDASSDGGAVLLKACDVRLNLTQALANCLHDTRQQSKVAHSFHDLIRQRVYGIACGYEDCNDAARIGDDPVHKLLLDRDPIEGAALASQSTLSRFENALGPKSLMRMATALADAVVARHRKRRRGRVRRVIIKAEVVRLAGREPKDNPRFVVTNLRRVPQRVYEVVYCQRAHIENRIKELHYGLAIDRTSCSSFWANQLRVLLTAAAYVLMQELRWRAARSGCAAAQVTTLRERLFKLGAWVERSVRRIVIHLPDHTPWRSEWCQVARALGAAPS